MASRLNILLLLALIASALYLVRVSYDARRLYSEINKAENEQVRLDSDFKRLEAERQAQATHLRVEKVARERLAMRTITPGVTAYVVDAPASAPAGGAAR